MGKLIQLSLLFILFGHILVTSLAHRDVPDFALAPVSEAANADPSAAAPLYQELRLSQPVTTEVHSATIAELPNGDLMAIWYGGSREGAKDVALYQSIFPVGADQWGPTEKLLKRERTETELSRYIKKIGNPVLYTDSKDRVHLFFVSVSVGGWAGSAINHMYSDDLGKTWSSTKRLVSSPFLNISTLVKSPPFEFSDGSLGLPVYHEFMGKFSEVIRLDENYDVVEKIRIDKGRTNIQPVFLVNSPQQGELLMRSVIQDEPVIFKAKVNRVDEAQGWRSWVLQHEISDRTDIGLPNPDSAIAGVSDGGYGVLAYNHSEKIRNVLSLAVRKEASSETDSGSWQRIHDFENASEQPAERYSYPYLIQGKDGVFHLIYSWNRQYIKHIRFNYSWLQEVQE